VFFFLPHSKRVMSVRMLGTNVDFWFQNIDAHISRDENAARIVHHATERGAEKIIIGQALRPDGESTPSSRRATRLAGAIRARTHVPVELWDETGSTKAAQEARVAMGVSRKKRGGHLDEIAATVILQSYLDAIRGENSE